MVDRALAVLRAAVMTGAGDELGAALAEDVILDASRADAPRVVRAGREEVLAELRRWWPGEGTLIDWADDVHPGGAAVTLERLTDTGRVERLRLYAGTGPDGTLTRLHVYESAPRAAALGSPAGVPDALLRRYAERGRLDLVPKQLEAGWDGVADVAPPAVGDAVLALAEDPRRLARALRAAGPSTLLHGDLRDENVALPPGGPVVLIDWGLAAWAPPAAELAWFVLHTAWRVAATRGAPRRLPRRGGRAAHRAGAVTGPAVRARDVRLAARPQRRGAPGGGGADVGALRARLVRRARAGGASPALSASRGARRSGASRRSPRRRGRATARGAGR